MASDDTGYEHTFDAFLDKVLPSRFRGFSYERKAYEPDKSFCGYFRSTVFTVLAVLLLAPLIIGLLWVAAFAVSLAERLPRPRRKGEAEAKPSLIAEFVKAQKRKVCPEINFYDPDEV